MLHVLQQKRFLNGKGILTNNLQDSRTQVASKCGDIIRRKLSNRKCVDELSLALALKEDSDERVEEAVEEMLNDLWRRIDGHRN